MLPIVPDQGQVAAETNSDWCLPAAPTIRRDSKVDETIQAIATRRNCHLMHRYSPKHFSSDNTF
jgi:hypothetical protein